MNTSSQIPTVTGIISKYAILGGLILILLSLVFFLVGIDKENYAAGISILAMLGICIWAVRDARILNSGKITFGEAFKVGALAQFFAGIISLVYFYLHIQFVDKNFMSDLSQKKVDEMKEKGLSEADIAQALSFMEYMNDPLILTLITSINIIVSSILFSLIVAAVMKKE